MSTLRIPVIPTGAGSLRPPFRRHYRSLIVNSLLQSAEEQLAQHRAGEHHLRAWRAERSARRVRTLVDHLKVDDLVPSYGFGPSVRVLATAALPVCGTLLIVNLVAFGIHSWTNTVAELAMMSLTMIWFFVSTVGSSETQGARTEVAAEAVAEWAPEALPATEPEIFYFSDRDVCVVWSPDEPSLTLKAVTRKGEPVELSPADSAGLSNLLRKLRPPHEDSSNN